MQRKIQSALKQGLVAGYVAVYYSKVHTETQNIYHSIRLSELSSNMQEFTARDENSQRYRRLKIEKPYYSK